MNTSSISKGNVLLSFDLDFTLINNREGIINSFFYALNEFELPLINRTEVEHMIGVPLEEMFSKITNIEPSQLARSFRDYYSSKGIYNATLLPGVKEKLDEFRSKSYKMGVITSKKEELAQKIVEILGISDYFEYVLGETEGRKELGKLDPSLKMILSKRFPNHQIIVIGDHTKDVILSNNLDCSFVGVLTGNHSADELKRFKDDRILIINSMKDLTIDKINSLL